MKIRRSPSPSTLRPRGRTILNASDRLIFIGPSDAVEHLEALLDDYTEDELN